MNLTAEDLLQIRKVIDESPVSRVAMKDNLVDHLCCAVEHKMKVGQSLDYAFEEALRELAPNGLKEIEQETYLLLNTKTIAMKKFVYSSGLFFCICASVGLFFKTLHWTGANELLILGLGGAAIVFIPLLTIIQNRHGAMRPALDRRIDTLAMISLMLISIGGVLKVLHVVTANEALLLGTAVFSLGFLPQFFLKLYRESIAQ